MAKSPKGRKEREAAGNFGVDPNNTVDPRCPNFDGGADPAKPHLSTFSPGPKARALKK